MGRKHVHKYYKTRQTGFVQVWACALPNCTHYMPKHLEQMVKGKATICWECGEEGIMGPLQWEMEKPKCDNCIGVNELDEVAVSPALEKLMREKGLM